ncbi:MAG: rhomboid family intramembrane serine protease [Gemmatales bacterium]|nr:rhomboid family intramembrane serine protease [Gemmatales bacterium]
MWLVVPYHADVPMARVPWANWGLMGITVLLSAAGISSYEQFGGGAWLWSWCLDRENFRVYQLLTHQFVHHGLVHLGLNMFFLFIFGNAINAKLGHMRFLAAYLCLGALSGLAWMATGQGKLLLGASGAICGIAGLFLIFYPLNEVSVFYLWFFFFTGDMGITSYSALWVITAFFFLDLAGALLWAGEPVAYIAHLAGYILGVAAGLMMLTFRWVTPEEGEETLLQVLGLSTPAAQKPKQKKRRSFLRSEPAAEPQQSPPSAVPPPRKPWSAWGD